MKKKIILSLIGFSLLFSLTFGMNNTVEASYDNPTSAYGEWGHVGGIVETRTYLKRSEAQKLATGLVEYSSTADMKNIIIGAVLGVVPQTQGTLGLAYALIQWDKSTSNHASGKKIQKFLKDNPSAKGVYIQTMDYKQFGDTFTVKSWNGQRSSIKSPSKSTSPSYSYEIKKMKINN